MVCFFNLQPYKTLIFLYFCHGSIKSKHQLAVLFKGNADGSDTLPTLVTGKCNTLLQECLRCWLQNMKLIHISHQNSLRLSHTTRQKPRC
jgi:hypothetical protein